MKHQYSRKGINMKRIVMFIVMFILVAVVGLFLWSIWEFYNANHTTAFYLLGLSAYLQLTFVIVLISDNNNALEMLYQKLP